MRFLFDYFPIICFFIAYKLWGVYTATAVAMIASVSQVSLFWLYHRRFEKVHLITLAFVLVLGGSTLIFHNPIFIKWKPTIVYWVFTTLLLLSQYHHKRPILSRMLDDKIKLPKKIWNQLNLSWAIFFLCMGILNLYVVYHYSTDAWVNFKLFGTLSLMLIFMLLQAIYMAKYIEHR